MIEDADSRARARVGALLDDKWTLEKLLGIGGMAAVYAARHRNGARAAVKVLHNDLSRYKEVRERFLREGYAANRVEHAGAVKVLDDDFVSSGPDRGTAYIVMELLEGESLQDRLERGPPVSEVEFLRMADEVLEVLVAAHERGVVHRDLKPENLFLVRNDPSDGPAKPRVKVLDFGLARLLQGQAITSYGLALGTPSFMSPEQAAGRIDEIDGRTDLFALAATGFRLRAGRRIHEAANPVDLVRKMASLAAPRIHEVVPDASQAFARVIDRALEFRREDRYETAAAMRVDTVRAIAELDAGVGATKIAVPLPPPVSAPPAQESSSSEPTVELSGRDIESIGAPRRDDASEESIHIPRRRTPILVLFALLVLVSGFAARLWMGARRASDVRTIPTIPTPSASIASPSAVAAASGGIGGDGEAARPEAGGSAAPVTPRTDAGRPPQPVASPPDAGASHRAPPRKVGPANVRRLPRKHATGAKRVHQ